MTNDRAAEIMKAIIFIIPHEYYSDEVEEAIHMGINALKMQELSNNSPELDKENGELISKQSAIDGLKEAFNPSITNFVKAKMVIDNLPSAQPERTQERTETHACDLIDRQAAIDFIDAGHLCNPNEPRWSDNEIVNFLKSRPSAQPEIIRCKDCKHWREGTVYLYCDKLFGMGVLDTYDYMTDEDDYCSMAERKTDEKENI